MLVFPDMTQLDFTGPYEILSKLPGVSVRVVWKEKGAVRSERGLSFIADTTIAECSGSDVIFVPGGPGQIDLMADDAVVDFLQREGRNARWVTSVCTGSLLLAAAGLLDGYRATCHWLSIGQLALFGAIPVQQRVVVDGNRITGAGVTSGIDFAFVLAQQLVGEHAARRLQLILEYDPCPPFDSGNPTKADGDMVEEVRNRTRSVIERRTTVSSAAARRLHNQN